ncbi:MAG: T9SS type A sorting domain-containing protein [Candidatus Neomarinimicrobiota bacterium]
MKKRILKIVCFCILATVSLFAQQAGYYFNSVLDTLPNVHGIAVDPDGKIWYASYDTSSGGIRVRNSDGTFVDSIKQLIIGGVTHKIEGGCCGMTTDQNGNILVVMNLTSLYRINYSDLSGMDYVKVDDYALTKPAVDNAGNVYVGVVMGSEYGKPIRIFDSDLDSMDVVCNSMEVWSRGVAVTSDGLDLYVGTLWHGVIQHYHNDDGLWALVDSLHGPTQGRFTNNPSSPAIDPLGRLWVNDEGAKKFYVYNLENMTYESIAGDAQAPFKTIRGVACNSDASKAYLSDFGSGLIQVWSTTPNNRVNPNQNDRVPAGYRLSQNYPNPFNPCTAIEFELLNSGDVTLKVFDLNGREITALVDRYLDAGNYRVDFNAAELSTGIYLYRLEANNIVLTKKMVFLK